MKIFLSYLVSLLTKIMMPLSRLRLAINGLPLKIKELTPDDMVLIENPPIYGFTLDEEMSPVSQLRCFASNHGK